MSCKLYIEECNPTNRSQETTEGLPHGPLVVSALMPNSCLPMTYPSPL